MLSIPPPTTWVGDPVDEDMEFQQENVRQGRQPHRTIAIVTRQSQNPKRFLSGNRLAGLKYTGRVGQPVVASRETVWALKT
jgi:hypothetical protein